MVTEILAIKKVWRKADERTDRNGRTIITIMTGREVSITALPYIFELV